MKTEMNTVKVRKTEELEAEQLGAHIGEIVRLHGSIYKIRKMSTFPVVLIRTTADRTVRVRTGVFPLCTGRTEGGNVCPLHGRGDPRGAVQNRV